MNVEVKSKAKRIITVQIPGHLQSPSFPLQDMSLRKLKSVAHTNELVPYVKNVRFGPVLTILPGEVCVLPSKFQDIEAIRNAILSRELIVVRELPVPPPAPPPASSASYPPPGVDDLGPDSPTDPIKSSKSHKNSSKANR